MTFLWHGLTDQGVQVPVQVDDQGRVVVNVPIEAGLTAWASTGRDGTIRNAFNIGSVTVSGSEGHFYHYTFAIPMPSTDYAVVVTANRTDSDTDLTQFVVVDLTTAGFTAVGLSITGGIGAGAAGAHGVLVTGP